MSRSILARITARLLGKAPTAPHQPPAPPPGDSPDEWCVGDLAECVLEDDRWISRKTGRVCDGPAHREYYRVAAIEAYKDWTGLGFSRWPGKSFNALAFRKITPRADEATAGTCTTIKSLLSLAPQIDEVA